MVHTYPGNFSDYMAYCERANAHERQRREAAKDKTVMVIEETWQLALFDEKSVLVQELIVGYEELS